ncbi:YncE family protein, partial [Rhodococcus erythropolis]|uniref:YncE family protein n=1 Tax=Rhodococcus erythropolis TaxID=1833 RepID=UPI0029499D6B
MNTHRDIIRRAGIAVIAGAALVLLSACGGGVEDTQPGISTPRTSTVQQAPALPGAQPISPSDRVYTADQTSNTVSVINPATNEVLGTIALGAQRLGDILGPQYLRDVDVHGLGFSRDGQYLDAVSVTSNTVTVIRTADNSIVSQTTVGRSSHEGFFSPDGQTVWVADRALSQLDIVDALHGGVIGHITTEPGPSKVLFSPDGSRAYVNHSREATIDVIDVASQEVVQRITGLADPFSSDMALSPDGTELWAAHKKVG